MITIRRWIVAGFVFSILAGAGGAQEKAPNALRLDEARIQFHLLPNPAPSLLGWYRLLYIFFPTEDSGLPVTGGLLQFGRVIQDGFEIRMAAAEKVEPGTRYPVRLRVLSSPQERPLAKSAGEMFSSLVRAQNS